jgi:energy-coupling factor transporter ATP-binding protein EcfA2
MQDPENQIVTDTVWHELAFGLESVGMDTQTMHRRVAETAHFFDIGSWFDRRTADLSGGQKQLLNLAAIVVMQPAVLVLDEPTSQLDPIAAKGFFDVLECVNAELGITVLITEHRLEDVLPLVDRVLYLERGGTLAYDGDCDGFVRMLEKNDEGLYAALPAATRMSLLLERSGKGPASASRTLSPSERAGRILPACLPRDKSEVGLVLGLSWQSERSRLATWCCVQRTSGFGMAGRCLSCCVASTSTCMQVASPHSWAVTAAESRRCSRRLRASDDQSAAASLHRATCTWRS